MFKQSSFKLILVSALMLLNVMVKAGITHFPGPTLKPSSAPVIVTSTATTSVSPMTDASFKDVSVTDMVTLSVDFKSTQYVATTGSVVVGVMIQMYDKNNVLFDTKYPSLTLNYQPFNVSTQAYVDKSVYKFNNAYKFTVTVQSMTVNGTAVTYLPSNLMISSDILLERYINFSPSINTQISMYDFVERDLDCDQKLDELEVKWATLAGAEEYQLEWTFVNNYDFTNGFYKQPLDVSYNFKNNSTRVTLNGKNSYKLNLNFGQGYLVFRVRGIGRDFTNSKIPLPGAWNLGGAGDSNAVVSAPSANVYRIIAGHESNKNWQYSATYAEEGKKKEVISYFDGSLRNRQSVTKTNTDSIAIVGETIYDHQGRPAVNILPAPVRLPSCGLTTTGLRYYQDLNRAENTSSEYSRIDFDLDNSGTDSCSSKLNKMDTGLGTSRYYSAANTEKTGFQAFVPDAEKYPFSQTEYTPDNTGRIRRQGGVGKEFQLTSTGHATKYYYGSPAQPQLDRLFGSEVGDATHYKKNVVIDANGQTSVTYLDQEGRTIATALAGSNLAAMDTLLTPNKGMDLTVDLFNKDANGVSTNNKVSIQGDGLEFATQLLVTSVASPNLYTFNYDMSIPQLSTYCLKPNICFNCVYDLEMSVTDDCGKIVPVYSGTGTNPTKKMVGRFTLNGLGNPVFDTLCVGGNYVKAEAFNLNLAPGNYTIIKKLTVNKAAKDYYTNKYFQTTNTPVQGTYVNTNCMKTYQQFIDASMAKIDTSDCNVSCAACVASLKGTYATLELARDGFVADGKGTELDFDFLVDQCNASCKEVSVCDASYQMMLMDVSPDGQYGEFRPKADGTPADMNLSVLNLGNRLPKNGSRTANWQNPTININGNTYSVYVDKNGVRTKIKLIPNGSSSYTPEVEDLTKVQFDAASQSYYTYPENLKYIGDFVYRWDDNWAKSLVAYHPEYPYYQSCLDYNNKIANFLYTSDTFDSMLVHCDKYSLAVSFGLVKAVNTAGSASSMVLMHQPTGDNRRDPFVTNFGTYGQMLMNSTNSYGTSGMSMPELAARSARCGTRYGETSPASTCGDFGKTPPVAAMLDNEWNVFKNMYLSEKQRIQKLRDEDFAKANKAYNGCYGNPDFNLVTSGMITSPFSSSPYVDVNQPCGFFLRQFYIDKKKRFNVTNSANTDLPGKSENDYQMYLQTGQSPMELNVQGFLNALAKGAVLTNTVSPGTVLQTIPEFTQDLYTAVYGSTPLPATYVPYNWRAASVGSTSMTANVVLSDGTTVKSAFVFNKVSTAFTWGQVVGISQFRYVAGNTPPTYNFKAVAAVANPVGSTRPYTYYDITGTTNFVITGYTPSTVSICKPNTLANDLAALWSAIALNGSFGSTNVDLSTSTYTPFLTKAIKNAIGATTNAIKWNSNGGSPATYDLYEVSNSKKLVMQIDSGGVTNFAYFLNMKNLTSVNGNTFRVSGNNSLGAYVGKMKGQVNLNISSVITPVSLGDCGLPTNVLCVGNEFQTGKDLFNLLKSVMLPKPFNTNPDLTKSIAYTPLLESYLGVSAQNSTTKIDYITLNASNDYKENITYNLICKCQIRLWHKGKGNQIVKFQDLSSITNLVPNGPANSDNNKYAFYMYASYLNNTVSDTIFGESCFPLRTCDNKMIADTSISPVKPYVTPCIINQINIAVANAQNEYKKYSDSVLTDFSARYTKHCMTAVENFTTGYKDREYHYTLYYYDQAGNLVKTIPPEGVEIVTDPTSLSKIKSDRTNNTKTFFTTHRLATTYTYNSLNQLVRQNVPDQEQMDVFEYTLSNGLDSRLKVTASQFISSTKGYLTGYIDFTSPSVFTRGYLYTTDDGGCTWTRMKNLVASDLKKIQMVSATIGYAIGTNGTVLKTNDGGNTWDMLSVPATATFNDLHFTTLQSPPQLNGIIIGDNNTVLITLDGGASWSTTSNGVSLSSGLLAGSTLTSITNDGGYFFMTGNLNGNGYIYRAAVNFFATISFNVSVPWTLLSSTSDTGNRSTDILKVNMVDATRGFAIAVDGNLLKTVDKGVNWSSVPTSISTEFRDIAFIKMNGLPASAALNGVAIIDSIPGKGLLYQTNNGGITWKQLGPSDGTYYNSVYFLQDFAYRDKGYAVGNKLKRIVYKNNNFVLVNVPVPTRISLDLKTSFFSDPNNGWVASANQAFYTHNAMASAPTWAEATFSGFNIKKIYFGNSQNSGIALAADGSLYKIIPSGNTYTFTKISTAGSEYFMDINTSYTKVFALTKIGSPNVIKTVNKTSVASASGLTALIGNSALTSLDAAQLSTFDVDSAGSGVLVGGTDGRLFQGLTTSTNVTWTDYSAKMIPLPLYDIECPGSQIIIAVGAEGTMLLSTDRYTYRTIPTHTTTQYNALKFNKDGYVPMVASKGLIAGSGGLLTRVDITSNYFITLTPLKSITTADLSDVVVKDNAGITKAYAVGTAGTLIAIPNLDVPVPVIGSPKPVGDFKGVAFSTTGMDVFVAGNTSGIYNYNGTSGAKVNGVYTSALYDASFLNSMEGYVIGNKVVRHTTDGGLTWSYVTRTSTAVMNAVATYAPGKALIVGAAGYQGTVNNNAIVDATLPATYYDVKFSGLTGYMIGTSGQKIGVDPNSFALTYTSLATGFPASTTFRGVHIFKNGACIAVGDGGKIYCYNTAWVSLPLLSGSPSLKDVYFHDDRNGYAVGDGGSIYRCAALADVWGYPSPPASPWSVLSLAGPNGASIPSNINLSTVAFSDRYKGFIGGSNTVGTPINFARVVNDESKLFTSRFWYDALGRMVLSQNTKQYNRKGTQSGRSDYSYTFYDALGRIVEVGEKTDNASGITFAGIFGEYIGGKLNPYAIKGTSFSSWANSGSVRREVTRTYYDTTLTAVPPGVSQQNLRKRVALVTYEDINDNNPLTYQSGTYYSYDIHGNVQTLWQHNKQVSVSGQDLKRLDYDYDLISGKVNLVRYQDGEADCFYHYYAYDADNRLTDVYTSNYPWKGQLINQRMVEKNRLWTREAKYFYYSHGPLARVELGEFQSQGIDYAYTLQGWIKGVNSDILSPSNDMGTDGKAASGTSEFIGRDAFGYSLNYFTGDYAAIEPSKWSTVPVRFESGRAGSLLLGARSDLYNGNITAMVTNISRPMIYSNAINLFPTYMPQGTAYKYDVLNRIKNVQAYTNVNTGGNQWDNLPAYNNRYKNTFIYDGNGNISKQTRYDAAGAVIDDLTYKYQVDGNGKLIKNNQLNYVTDAAPTGTATDDIETQPSTNYKYDDIGNLMHDELEQIDTIKWTVYGKIKSIRRLFNSSKPDLEFKYDASGNRIAKIEKPHGSSKENGGTDIVSQWKTTYYVRDAQGNVMGNYYHNPTLSSYKLIERDLYGSDRLGTENTQIELIGALSLAQPFNRTLGNKYFEGKNHLGNVLSVFTDKKIPRDDNSDGIIDYFQPEVVACNDYTAFGAPMNERNFSISQNAGAVIYQSNFSSGVDNWKNNWGPSSNTTITTVSSQLKVTANVTWGGVNYKVATIPGKQYRYTLNIASITNLSPYDFSYFARRMDSVNILVQAATQPGVYSLVFTAQETFTYLCVELNKAGASMQIASAKLELLPDLAYRYGFNGKEKDDEVVGNGNEYDYGARIYNPRLGRFLSTDPLSHKFPYWSPYQFAGNTPIQAIDLDGREILFVNGHYQDNWFGRNVLGADKPGKAYWGTGFTEAAQKFFNDRTPITSSNYINGSSSIGIDESGSDRFTRGYNYAKANLSTITAGYVKSQSEFKIVTHSEGAAYGAGIAQALIEEGWKVGTIVHLSADEGDEFSTPKGPTTYQFGYDGDWVTGNKQIEGTDKSGEGNSDALGWDEVHGATKSASVFKKVEDLKSVTTQENIDKNGKGHTTQKQGSAPNGTKFTKINDQKVTK